MLVKLDGRKKGVWVDRKGMRRNSLEEVEDERFIKIGKICGRGIHYDVLWLSYGTKAIHDQMAKHIAYLDEVAN